MVAVIAAISLLFFATRPDEPTHDGKPLSYWLGRLDSEAKVRLEAETAIRSMGTNAVPHLIRMLLERDAAWKSEYNRRVRQLFGLRYDRARPFFMGGRSILAAKALGIIGPPARAAVPFLIQNMTNAPFGYAMPPPYHAALSAIGADSILPLIETLSHPDPLLSSCAYSALAMCDTNLVLAVPELIRLAKSQDKHIRSMSTGLLGFVPGDSRALSVLVESLQDASDAVRYAAAKGLAVHGAKATNALPALMELLNDSNTNMQTAVRRAIAEIDTNLVIEGTQVRRKTESNKGK